MGGRAGERAVQTLMARNPHINYCEQDSIVTVPDSEDTAMAAIGRPGGGGGTTQTTPWGVTRVGGTRSGAGSASGWSIAASARTAISISMRT